MDSLNKYLVYGFVRRKNVRIQKILGKGKKVKVFQNIQYLNIFFIWVGKSVNYLPIGITNSTNYYF